MPIRALAAAAVVACAASSALALETYIYEGLPLETTSPEEAEFWNIPPKLGGYRFAIVIDEEALPGGTLRDAEVRFEFVNPGYSDTSAPAGLELFVNDPNCALPEDPTVPCARFAFYSTVRTELEFETDADKEIVSWFGDFMDGPPDGGIDNTVINYDWLYIAGYPTYLSAGPGSWTRLTARPVPAPATILLLGPLAALGAGWAARRRTRE